MIKVLVISGVGDISGILNDFDVTNGEIKYYPFIFKKADSDRILNSLKKILGFLCQVKNFDVVLITFINRYDYLYAQTAKMFGIPVIAQWCGTDVYSLLNSGKKYKGLNVYVSHLARSRLLQEELETKNIAAKIVWGASENISYETAKMPEKHAVYVYLPQGKETFYGYDMIQQVIDRYPEIDFYITANEDKELFPQPNVKLLGWISKNETDELYNRISIVIRCPKHDGYSRILMEAHFKGKEIIFNLFEGPYMRCATTVDEICSEMDDILSRPPTPRQDAHDYAIANFTPQSYSQKMAEEIRRVLRD